MIASAASAGIVFVIDDDASMRKALECQFRTAGVRVECFESAQDYLDRTPTSAVGCIVSDVRMPGRSGA
ncbi:MAG TPA: response regulator [Burkholderiales bacterium]|nr:response regulator [Burkholderiales bacterium]